MPTKPSSSKAKTVLTFIALLLFGVFIGVLASFFLPITTAPVTDEIPAPQPAADSEISDTITPEEIITPIPTPTATPSALLNLRWNMMTVKSPLTTFSSYRIYYPTTWSIKEYKNTPGTGGSTSLTLTKGLTTLSFIQQDLEGSACSYPTSEIKQNLDFASYREIFHNSSTWRWGLSVNGDSPTYIVCQSQNNSFSSPTTVGFINLSGANIDNQTLEEFNYILEKIVIIP
ncbi:MAG: hypothetical protein UW68_C0013G0010 [Candidatus Collierbacteria bacterium GW2011_GWB1_44_6]|uniref:Uncharacterized protein n=2 Tax=Candidatus Collieribacteriota TaxID=1752725 RepID=A0A0G1LWR4_9BACT|nr:MAG: hypothetical protein UV68_C0014G0002 [Candidatus Collierbacteria bacterium GW2011_GWC2_43_12]KKT73267.1 MAG: hypothetical protein UW68_C0013G0010 [Candidatus Collierbacteria bacterium GW2011_GWB1_44_6]